MDDSGEDFFGQLLGILLLIGGIGWLIQWVCRKIMDNIGPILIVVTVIGVFIIVGAIVKKANATKAAVAKWEQSQLVPLLSSLRAMEKLNDSETFVASLPGKLAALENRVPALEQRAAEADSQAKSLNANQV